MLLVVDRQGSVLRYQYNTIRLEQEGKKPQRIPLKQLEQVVIYGNPLVEASVWRALADAKIPAIVLASRGQASHAVLGSGLATQLPLRRRQHHYAASPDIRLQVAKYFVEHKLSNYALPLQTLQTLYEIPDSACEAFKQQLVHTQHKLPNAVTAASLLGLEGQAAHAWFALLAKHLPEHWKFTGRNRRPPRDPVNALLSLAYTLMMAEVRQAIMTHGLDPALGFLHQDHAGRDSLVLDMGEIFRAAVDDFVLHCLHDIVWEQNSFYFRETEGCRLSKSARPLFYQAWGARRYRWPRPYRHEIDNLVDRETADEIPNSSVAWLPEILNGQVMHFRAFMKTITENDDEITRTSDGTRGDEPSLEAIKE